MIIPKNKVKAKALNTSPPKINNTKTVSRVVPPVKIVLLIVWLILVSIISERGLVL